MNREIDDPELDAKLACESPILLDILRHWKTARGEKNMPSQSDVNLLEFPPDQLPHILVLDVEREPRLRMRWKYIGSHATTVMNRDMTGAYCDEIYNDIQLTSLRRRTDWVLQNCLPLRSNGHSTDPERDFDTNEALFMPMSENGTDVDSILMGSVYKFHQAPNANFADGELEAQVQVRTRELYAAKENADAAREILEMANEKQKRLLNELEASEDRFKDFAESTSDWFWEMDANLSFTYISDRFQEITGVGADLVIGRTGEEAGINFDRKLQYEKVMALESHRPFKGFEHSLKDLDGQTIHLSSSGKPIFNEDGSFKGFRGTGSDITERKSAQLVLQNALANAKLANQAKSEFLATMSHEFRTPLNAIIGFSSMIRSEYFGSIEVEKYVEYANDIHNSGEHMLALVNDVLDISAIEAGKRILSREYLNLSDMLTLCIGKFEVAAREKGIEISLEMPNEMIHIFADERSINQIIQNLLSNAVKFTNLQGKISVLVKATDENIVISVSDDGIGISPDTLPKITEPFTQAVSNPDKAQEGSGLGLSIVKTLIELHDGKFQIESEFGIGTTVTIEFSVVAK